MMVRSLLLSVACSMAACSPAAPGEPADAGLAIDAGERPDAGQPVDAGPPLALVGRQWTPNRGPDGKVLLTDYPQLPANQWVLVEGPKNKLREVATLPSYPNGYGGPDDFANTLLAWGGAAWDSLNDRMNISGGGHADASAASTAILAVDARTMSVERVVARQPLSSALRLNAATGRLEAGEGYPGGSNAPLATGVPGSMHTYNGLRWLSPTVMSSLNLSAPKLGGLFYPGNARSVVNLDTGAYTPLFWKTAYYDISYISAVQWKSRIILPRGSFFFGRWDMSLTEMTDWQGTAAAGFNPTPTQPAFGRDLPVRTSSKALPYGGRLFVDMPERGQLISFSGTHYRVRYGEAEDADASDWSTHQDTITLTGPASLALNTADNFRDEGTRLLNNAGGSYLARTGELFICPNTKSAAVYRIEGLATTNTGVVTQLAGSETLTTSGNGTFGRFVVFERGGAKLALRVTGVDAPIEVLRIVAP